MSISDLIVWFKGLGYPWMVTVSVISFGIFGAISITLFLLSLRFAAELPYLLGKPRLTSESVFETSCGNSKMRVEHYRLVTNAFEGVERRGLALRFGTEVESTKQPSELSIQVNGGVPVRYLPQGLLPEHRQIGANPSDENEWVTHIFIHPDVYTFEKQHELENCLTPLWPEIMRRARNLSATTLPKSDTLVFWRHPGPLKALDFHEQSGPQRVLRVDSSGRIDLINRNQSEQVGRIEDEGLTPVFHQPRSNSDFDHFQDENKKNIREFYHSIKK